MQWIVLKRLHWYVLLWQLSLLGFFLLLLSRTRACVTRTYLCICRIFLDDVVPPKLLVSLPSQKPFHGLWKPCREACCILRTPGLFDQSHHISGRPHFLLLRFNKSTSCDQSNNHAGSKKLAVAEMWHPLFGWHFLLLRSMLSRADAVQWYCIGLIFEDFVIGQLNIKHEEPKLRFTLYPIIHYICNCCTAEVWCFVYAVWKGTKQNMQAHHNQAQAFRYLRCWFRPWLCWLHHHFEQLIHLWKFYSAMVYSILGRQVPLSNPPVVGDTLAVYLPLWNILKPHSWVPGTALC